MTTLRCWGGCQFRIYYPAKIAFKNKEETNTFVGFKKVLEEFTTGTRVQQARLTGVLQAGREGRQAGTQIRREPGKAPTWVNRPFS